MSSENKKTYIFNPGDRIDIGTVDSLRSDLETVIDAKKVDEIHIDMKFVQVCDMYGVAFLNDSAKLINKSGLSFSISLPRPLIKGILIKSGIDTFKDMVKED